MPRAVPIGRFGMWNTATTIARRRAHPPAGRWRGRVRIGGTLSKPDEHAPSSTRDLLNVDQFFDEFVELLIVEPKLALQRAQRDAGMLLEPFSGSGHGAEKAHSKGRSS